MKRLILLLLSFPCLLLAQPIPVSGPVFGTWERENEYHVGGNLSVPNGRTLILEEGVRVKFFGAFSLTVSGEILCNGTEENPIVFTCDTIQVPSRWKGIRVNTAEGTFYHTIVEHADYDQIGEEAASGVNCNGSTVSFYDCTVRHCRSRPPIGIYDASVVHIERCTFSRNFLTVGCCGGGIGVRGNSHADIIDCEINWNSALEGAGIYVNDGSTANIINTRILNNDAHLRGGGIFVDGGGDVVIRKCSILYNSVNGHGGGMLANGSNLLVERCNFIGNESSRGAQVHSESGDGEFNSCIFAPYNGPFGIGPALEIQPDLQLHHNIIYTFFTDPDFAGTLPDGLGVIDRVNANGDSCDIYNNVYQDPHFVSVVNNDYNLLPTSPCIDAGDPLLEYDPDSTIADIGVEYYNQISPVGSRLFPTPRSMEFHAAYPNPFNPSTTLEFSLVKPERVSLRIVDVLGRTVDILIDRNIAEGTHSIQWNAAGLPSGIYFAELVAGDFRSVQKLMLMK